MKGNQSLKKNRLKISQSGLGVPEKVEIRVVESDSFLSTLQLFLTEVTEKMVTLSQGTTAPAGKAVQ